MTGTRKLTVPGLCCAALLMGGAIAAGAAGMAFAQDAGAADAAASRRATALDPEEYKYVQPVCTRCHSAQNFLRSRSWPEWQTTFSRMQANGARATDAQWGHIYQYFLRSLTSLNPNRADEDELSAVLDVDEKTAIAIVQRRPFTNPEELESVPGLDKALIEKLKPRLWFDLPTQGR